MRDTGATSGTVTAALRATRDGQPDAAERLLALVYSDLRSLAKSKMAGLAPGQTLQTTALVHEAWLKVSKKGAGDWENRAHFFGAAARAMRNILVDQARRRSQRGRREEIDEDTEPLIEPPAYDILALDEALNHLERIEPRKTRVVHLKFFAGLQMGAIADLLGVSLTTVENDWRFARAWLQNRIESAKGNA